MNKTISLLFALACLVAITAAVETRLKYRQEPITLTEETADSQKKTFVPPTDAEIQDQFAQFKNKHGKKFNAQEEALKYKKFSDNYNLIQAANVDHENNGRSLRLGVNQFADMSQEEWFAYSHGTAPGLEDDGNDPTSFFGYSESQGNLRGSKLIQTELPTSVDWYASGNLNPPKNQGACGSCWAFSATGALEGLWKIKNPTSPLRLFSQQQIVDCTNKATSTWGMYGCSGGSISTAFRYVANQSIALAGTYPYKALNGTCYYNAATMGVYNTNSTASPNGYLNVARNNSVSLQTQVALQPVSVSLWASTSTFQLYKSGVYFEAGCGIQSTGALTTNHGVLISGYGVNVVNSTYSENYWIVQNSWGATWGNQGYIWVGYTPDAATGTVTNPGTCGIHMYPAAPTQQ